MTKIWDTGKLTIAEKVGRIMSRLRDWMLEPVVMRLRFLALKFDMIINRLEGIQELMKESLGVQKAGIVPLGNYNAYEPAVEIEGLVRGYWLEASEIKDGPETDPDGAVIFSVVEASDITGARVVDCQVDGTPWLWTPVDLDRCIHLRQIRKGQKLYFVTYKEGHGPSGQRGGKIDKIWKVIPPSPTPSPCFKENIEKYWPQLVQYDGREVTRYVMLWLKRLEKGRFDVELQDKRETCINCKTNEHLVDARWLGRPVRSCAKCGLIVTEIISRENAGDEVTGSEISWDEDDDARCR